MDNVLFIYLFIYKNDVKEGDIRIKVWINEISIQVNVLVYLE